MDANLKTVLLTTAPLRKVEVCDIGANPIDNAAPYAPLLDHGLARITGFEPQPEALAKLNAAKSDDETYFPNALGTGAPVDFNIYRGSGFSSCYGPDQSTIDITANLAKYMEVLETFNVETSRLDDLTDVPQIDMLKIDVQGSELNIISNGRGKLSNAVCVWTEVRFFPLYENEPDFGDLQLELVGQGFRLHDFDSIMKLHLSAGEGPTRRRWRRQIVDGDAIYFRDLRTIGDWTEHQLRATVQIATLVTQSKDIAGFALAELVRRGIVDQQVLDLFNDSKGIHNNFPHW
ncbi:hypothetical protein BVC71_09600 [Marivivens niveibacter]|uniref:Methyltransferase FkbM domain-containing protein n=1 Tax=Marivivens niveibacter TaxID=1930667 RepID=A0A251WWW0_9RHOB|nr:FkbM family methyltransferase [Marivivens niveibacter]OUD08959.1 hypothetical protein BVC71_09600 [Marivivens niveibacter]